jgi:hypothetical protein
VVIKSEISVTQEAEMGRITVQGQPGRKKKFIKTPSPTNKPGVVVSTTSCTGGVQVGQAGLGKKHKTLSKK